MSWTKGRFLRCDGECGMSFDNADNLFKEVEARIIVRNWGWVYWGGQDFCNDCYADGLRMEDQS